MESEKFEKERITTDEYSEFIMNSVKPSNISKQMEDSREHIWRMIEEKVHIDEMRFKKLHDRKRTILYAAAISILLIISASSIGYMQKYKRELGLLAKTQIELNVPTGSISKVVLPDGSVVTLNGGAHLTYPSSFANNRQVYFSGEGFFDIAKDRQKPFKIYTENITVKVIGTKFGLKSYKNDVNTMLTMEEGVVSVLPVWNKPEDDIILTNEQQLIVNNNTREVQCRYVQPIDFTAWKDGIVIFRDETLYEIAKTLERRFNVQISIKSDAIGDERYVARFQCGENVEQILDKLSYKRSWKYVKRNNDIEIMLKKTS